MVLEIIEYFGFGSLMTSSSLDVQLCFTYPATQLRAAFLPLYY